MAIKTFSSVCLGFLKKTVPAYSKWAHLGTTRNQEISRIWMQAKRLYENQKCSMQREKNLNDHVQKEAPKETYYFGGWAPGASGWVSADPSTRSKNE